MAKVVEAGLSFGLASLTTLPEFDSRKSSLVNVKDDAVEKIDKHGGDQLTNDDDDKKSSKNYEHEVALDELLQ